MDNFNKFELIVLKSLVDTRISRICYQLDFDANPNQYISYLSKRLKDLEYLSNKLSFFY